ncbi:bacterial Ig-like domain-containing protein [Acholeplasma granularum]|uniref:bacterial Ig-like domain-containing protein n=1 Tax=Acholeplasma granularum TaxID=264635 RepID=UPI000470D492|nr:bacterial Ig-like domain-containing protein [Acholeplasma granularum]
MKKNLLLGLLMMMLLVLVGCVDTNPPVEPTLHSIVVKSEPTKTTYTQAEDLDLSGLVIEAKYSDDTTKVVASSNYTVTGYDKNKLGEQTLTVTHDGKTVTFKVTVEALVVEKQEVGIELTNPTKLEYFIDETFDDTGLVVKVKFDDDSEEVLDKSKYTVTGFDSTKADTVTISVTYKTFTKTFEVTVVAEDKAPIVVGLIHHWMPGAIDALVTASVDLTTASVDSFSIKYGEIVLEEFLDYELDGEELTIFGAFLHAQNLEPGVYEFTLISANGETPFEVSVVLDPRDTSIPTKLVEGIDMSGVEHFALTAPIAGAPSLLITEIGGDMGSNDFIEVFNNTTQPYNLKGHRIVFADTARALNADPNLAFVEPFAMSSGVYIYQDYIIEPLSSAIIWVVNAYPWSLEATHTPNTEPREIIEDETVNSQIFGPNSSNLSIDKFKATWNFASDVDVFPVRPQYFIHNNTSAYNAVDGLGQPVAKAAASRWAGFNTSIDNRAVQIQKVDQETYFEVSEDTTAPAGSVFFKYEWVVTNKEEEVYVDGVLDRAKLVGYGTPGSSNYRQSINGVGIRVEYFNAAKESLGYATTTGKTVDAYNYGNANYLELYENAVTPIVSAMIYPRLEDTAGVLTTAKWGPRITLEYTVPAADSIFMRFIPRDSETIYETFYADKPVRLAGLAKAVTETQQNNIIVVPESSAYPVSYLSDGWNTANKQGWFNFYLTKPSA